MRKLEWTARGLAVAALLVLATAWALREADVIRWGAAGETLGRIEALEDRIVGLEQQVAQAAPMRAAAPTPSDDRVADVEELVLERIVALEDRIAALERQPSGAVDQFIVVSTNIGGSSIELAEFCITYTVPGGVLDRCKLASYVSAGENTWVPTTDSEWIPTCFHTARIGEPLPACWR